MVAVDEAAEEVEAVVLVVLLRADELVGKEEVLFKYAECELLGRADEEVLKLPRMVEEVALLAIAEEVVLKLPRMVEEVTLLGRAEEVALKLLVAVEEATLLVKTIVELRGPEEVVPTAEEVCEGAEEETVSIEVALTIG